MVSRDLYPFTSHFLDLDGLRYHYLDEGQGQAIVMVHGNPTWSFYFRDLVAGLRDQYRIIVPDHIGCGLSDKPDDSRYPYRLQRRIDDLGHLLEYLVPRERITLVLHDWGGMIGMGWAIRHPDRIARIVILNTAAFPLPAGKKLPWQIWVVRNTPMGPLLVRGLNLFSHGLVRSCVVRRLPAEVRAGYLEPYDSWDHRRAVLRFVEDIPMRPGDPSHSEVQLIAQGLPLLLDVPMLVCWGEQDFVFDGAFLAEWRRRFPAAEVHSFADAGHLVLEDAGERILPLVQDFLRRHPVAGP